MLHSSNNSNNSISNTVGTDDYIINNNACTTTIVTSPLQQHQLEHQDQADEELISHPYPPKYSQTTQVGLDQHNLAPRTVSSYFTQGLQQVLHTIQHNKLKLMGTAGAWFILDVVFYANGLFSGQVKLYSRGKKDTFIKLIIFRNIKK